MGESVVAASLHEDKQMGETARSVPTLDVSVSFGRFENDSLSWEKWSSFSPNKYLEEVEKCATPGSVAQKKAYFEAHYKKIAARKAEMMDQKQMECESFGNDDAINEEQTAKTCIDSEFNAETGQNYVEGFMQESETNDEWSNGLVDEPLEDAAMDIKAQDLLEAEELSVDGVKEEIKERLDNPKLEKTQDVLLIKEEETPPMGSQDRIEESPNNLEKQMESIPKKEDNVRPGKKKESKKVTPLSKVTDFARVKKKQVSPVTKLPQFSTPKISKLVSSSTALSSSTPKVSKPVVNSATLSRSTPKVFKPILKSSTQLSRSTPHVSKPTPNSTVLSASQSSTRKLTGSSIAKSKIHSVGKVAPKALHMSLSMDSPHSDPASLTNTRKSFIMEEMRDKDIVKRAFKTFQNNFHQLKASAEQRSLEANQVTAKGAEIKISSFTTPRKENAGTLKASGMDKRTAKAAPSSFSLKSDDGVDKRKELPKKLEEKSNSKEAGTTRLQKPKEKEADSRKSRQNFNFRATPLPSFYHGHKVSKAPLDKEGSKTLRI